MRQIDLISPKQDSRLDTSWDGFFPYYAGYPERFVSHALKSLDLCAGAVILDPWNGSGTTPYAAARLGLNAIGLDINPVMAIVAKARMLPSSESSSLVPLGRQVVEGCRGAAPARASDPLCVWFGHRTAGHLRAIESEIRQLLVGKQLGAPHEIGTVSCIASALYVALFSVARQLTRCFRSSNPTWLRSPRAGERRISASMETVAETFEQRLLMMASALLKDGARRGEPRIEIGVGDSTCLPNQDASIDAVLTSPPYCTRIDYATTTRLELAVLNGLLPLCHVDLGRRMLGSVRVPRREVRIRDEWGHTCRSFIENVSGHSSKASSGYYLKTHLDYFDKLDRSIGEISRVLKRRASAVLVVQDSFYKDIHNDVPQIVTEISQSHGLKLTQRKDFALRRSMAAINRRVRAYREHATAIEAVLCFQKE